MVIAMVCLSVNKDWQQRGEADGLNEGHDDSKGCRDGCNKLGFTLYWGMLLRGGQEDI